MNIKEESIKRYEEKISWAKTQNPDEKPDRKKMYNAIGYCWFIGCLYCINDCCDECVLNMNLKCCNGLWDKMFVSSTWREWIDYAEQVLQYIKDNG
jgi:hypothetical protein